MSAPGICSRRWGAVKLEVLGYPGTQWERKGDTSMGPYSYEYDGSLGGPEVASGLPPPPGERSCSGSRAAEGLSPAPDSNNIPRRTL